MYTAGARDLCIWKYRHFKRLAAKFFRFEFVHDPHSPKVVSHFPGEAHKQAIEKMQQRHISDSDYYNHLQRFVNFKGSKGSYMMDCCGNQILDLNASASGMPLGYNNDDLIIARMDTHYDRFLTHKSSSLLPPADFADMVRDHLIHHAPKGTSQVSLVEGATRAEANEHAIAVAF